MLDERLERSGQSGAGDADAPFRTRLQARDGTRPQSTLAILSGRPRQAGNVVRPVSVVEMRPAPAPVLMPPRQAEPEVETRRRPAPAPVPVVPPPQPAIRPAGRAEAWAPARAPSPAPSPTPIPAAPAPVAKAPPPQARGGDDDETGSRFGDLSQFAFAGLAVLGLAGLSFMAAENALSGKPGAQPEGDEASRRADAGNDTLLIPQGAVSAVAVQEAAIPAESVPTPWFDYRGVADYLKARVEAFESAEREAARLQQLDAERLAANAIAEAEAERLAMAAQAEANAAASAAAAQDAERQRLAREEAERIANAEAERLAAEEAARAAAQAEADRLAALEAERAAAALAEQQRLADQAAQRAAEAEAQRLAEIETRRLAAEAEAARLAEIEARRAAELADQKRLADLEATRAAEAEAQRLAALEARRAAEAEEARRLAEAEAKRLAELEAARLAAAASASPAITLAAVTPAAPVRKPAIPRGAASLKPPRPVVMDLAATDTGPVTRTAPVILTAQRPEVRAFGADTAAPKAVDTFIGERVQRTTAETLDAAALTSLQAEFLDLVRTGTDGSVHALATPDGRTLEIRLGASEVLDPVQASVRTVGYSRIGEDAVVRAYGEPASVSVSVMCRDVAYALPGQERGRFAACQGADGSWVLARAADPAALPV